MDSKKQMVIIDNKIETKNILLCEFNEQSSKWSIKYVNSNKLYYFSKNRIFLLQNPKILTENDYYFYLDNKLNNEIKEIYEFEGSDKFYYHVIFKNDKNFDCDDKRLKKICKNSYNFIEYMKKVSEVTSLKKDNGEYINTREINKLESNHIRVNLEYDGLTIHIRTLKEYIDENFKLYAIQEKKYLKLCKHCGKAFIANNPKAVYDTFSCKNQENVYNSRARLSSNVIKTKDGLTVKVTPSEELSNEIIKKLKKKK